jgi:microcystin-dependent protein
MSDQFVGEIRMFGGDFAPFGWALCQGQTLAIDQYAALFSLIGTIYGGDGVTTFQLPNLQGRVPIHQGQGQGLSNYVIGQSDGSETVTLTAQQIPSHTHPLMASTAASSIASPATDLAGDSTLAGVRMYAVPTTPVLMSPNAVSYEGASQPHENLMPFQVVNFIIALDGVFPSRN